MGKSKNSHTVFGTKGNPQGTLSQGNAERKARELAEKKLEEEKKKEQDELVKPLVDAGVKFTKEDVLFVTKDESGQLIWLEKGNEDVGLKHIEKHVNQFVKEHVIVKSDLTSHIKDIIATGKIISSKQVLRNGKLGYEKIYLYKNTYYVVGAIGLNGFIVSVYPIGRKKK